MKPARREFIPALRSIVCEQTPIGTADEVNASIDKWRDDQDAESPLDCGVFGVCDYIANDMDEKAEREEK